MRYLTLPNLAGETWHACYTRGDMVEFLFAPSRYINMLQRDANYWD